MKIHQRVPTCRVQRFQPRQAYSLACRSIFGPKQRIFQCDLSQSGQACCPGSQRCCQALCRHEQDRPGYEDKTTLNTPVSQGISEALCWVFTTLHVDCCGLLSLGGLAGNLLRASVSSGSCNLLSFRRTGELREFSLAHSQEQELDNLSFDYHSLMPSCGSQIHAWNHLLISFSRGHWGKSSQRSGYLACLRKRWLGKCFMLLRGISSMDQQWALIR